MRKGGEDMRRGGILSTWGSVSVRFDASSAVSLNFQGTTQIRCGTMHLFSIIINPVPY